MKKRSNASRPNRPKQRSEKPLLPVWDGLDPQGRVFFGSSEEDNPEWLMGTLTPDLRAVAKAFAGEKTELLQQFLRFPYNVLAELPGGDAHIAAQPRGLTAELPAWALPIVDDEIQSAVRAGFYFAVIRYRDELRGVPELEVVLRQRVDAAHKGGDTRRKKAAPRHEAIRKRFRELEKSIPKTTARYLRLAKEFGMAEGSIGRIIRAENS